VNNPSMKNLKRLLVTSILLFVGLLIYISYLMIQEPNESSTELKESYRSGNFNGESNTEERQNKDSTKPNSEKIDSIELIPKNEALQKDEKLDINLKKIELSLEKKSKVPFIDKSNFHSTFGRRVVFIYFSHNRESFLPYFKNGTIPEMAYHSQFNVTLIGERLGRALKLNGVSNSVSDVDIINMLNERNLDFNSSYRMSRELVVGEQNVNRNIEMYFDIHRDSLPRKYTTTSLNGESYAKISFVIGSAHPNYQENLNFTNTLNELIEENYPGLSRGIIIKDQSQGNGVYNQDLSPNRVIIEIGGVENSFEELYRTADILGYAISKYYWENVH
jgi:stage II sporulation protein P